MICRLTKLHASATSCVFEGFHDLPVFVRGRAQALQIDRAPRIALDVQLQAGT
jgi:hypothetical protein